MFAPVSEVQAYEPPAALDAEFAETPFDFLPPETPRGVSHDDWLAYVSHRKRIGDAVPITQLQRRMLHEQRAVALFGELDEMRGVVRVDSEAWPRARDAAMREAALAADPDANELIIVRDMARNISVQIDLPQDPHLRPNLQQIALESRVKRAIGTATGVGLDWKFGPVGDSGATQVARVSLRP